jgi:hypothetical protein
MTDPLAAFALSRRSISFALFRENQLECVRHRHLHSSQELARKGITEFVRRAIEEFAFDSCALEAKGAKDTLVAQYYEHLQSVLRESAVSIRPVETADLFNGFSIPAVKTRHQLRQAIERIWPVMDDRRLQPLAFDSVAVGLFAQTQRLIDINLQQP